MSGCDPPRALNPHGWAKTGRLPFAPIRPGEYPDQQSARPFPGVDQPMNDELDLQQPLVEAASRTLEVPANGHVRSAAGAMILLDNVSKLYQGGVVGLQDVSLQIDKGEFV